MSTTKIVLIQADDSLRSSISTCLNQSGFRVIPASYASGAIEMIRCVQPDLIILENKLPDFNSLAIIRSIRSESMLRPIPVILMGSSMTEGDVLLGLEVGADLCLSEAFHSEVFIARVRSLLRRANQIHA